MPTPGAAVRGTPGGRPGLAAAGLGARPGFTTTLGTPLDDGNVRRTFRRLLRTAGLPSMRLRDLRHGCATLLLAQGVHPRLVMETLGHSPISLTLGTYSHILPALRREVASRMDAALGS